MSEQKPMIKGVLLDIENDEAKVVEFEPTLENYYKMLHCDLIDIVSRTIGYNRSHKVFDIVCDDEGTFKRRGYYFVSCGLKVRTQRRRQKIY